LFKGKIKLPFFSGENIGREYRRTKEAGPPGELRIVPPGEWFVEEWRTPLTATVGALMFWPDDDLVKQKNKKEKK
jgi:hypothetical protein